jgi:hypothetical protein
MSSSLFLCWLLRLFVSFLLPSQFFLVSVLNKVEVLTKGDNNRVDDRGLYAPGQLWLQREDILGRARGTLRYLGMVTIILNDYPILKYFLIGIMALFVLTNKES